ncbi:MAG: polysaccharide biosynthesis protein [Vicinamibacterales bacterium]
MIPRLDAATLERILGRPQCEILTERDRASFAGERVVITGGGGSVGSELARQVAACEPEALVLLDHSEYNLFKVEQELRERFPALPLDVVLGDVSRPRIMRQACEIAHPSVVYHAAAYKHVTMAERAVDPAIETNVFGTLTAARVAREAGARFVLVSSDKAAQPASVMGATKRLAELATLSLEGPDFRPLAVRFGNILGSSGSLLEIVLECIRDGRPIPLTDPKATRYFMTAQEAAALVLKADRVGFGGEIYWLDMGQPVAIVDIIDRVRHFALEAGLRPVPIKIVGLRPGEKLREELTSQGLELCRTTHRRIWKARQPEIDRARIRRIMRALRVDLRAGDLLAALQDLSAAVPEYTPSRSAWQRATGTSLEPVLAAAPVPAVRVA